MKPREIIYKNHGIAVEHDQPCPIYHSENAVFIIGKFYFQPSWKAQKAGFKIVRADNWLRRILIKFFSDDFSIKIPELKEDE
jgi:hypothetical protein